MIRKNCEYCGKFIWKYPYQIKKGEGKYCSYKCKGEFQKNKIELECEQCGKVFMRQPNRMNENSGIFCSKKCHFESRKNAKNSICKQCGKEFYIPDCDIREDGNFCSRSCFYEHNHKYPKTLDLRKIIRSRQDVNNLSDSYVRGVLTKGAKLRNNDIPQIIVEAKRQNLKIKRLIRNKN